MGEGGGKRQLNIITSFVIMLTSCSVGFDYFSILFLQLSMTI